MLLFCPLCQEQHIDEPHGDWTNPPHKTHQCQHCKYEWKHANVPTNGVRELPGVVPHMIRHLDYGHQMAYMCEQIGKVLNIPYGYVSDRWPEHKEGQPEIRWEMEDGPTIWLLLPEDFKGPMPDFSFWEVYAQEYESGLVQLRLQHQAALELFKAVWQWHCEQPTPKRSPVGL
jgi:hypothetical protein